MTLNNAIAAPRYGRPERRPKYIVLAILGTVFGISLALASTNPPPQLHISISGSPGHQTPELSWSAQPGAVYTIQSRTSLSASSPWVVIEPVSSSSNVARWKAPELNSHSDALRFYQLQAPEPAIFRVEPTVVSTDGGLVYLIGQCLGTGGVARVGGLVLQPNVLQAGSTYSLSLPSLPEGDYDLEWLEGGQVVARRERVFSVTVPPGKILQRLLEPPADPPASPYTETITPAALKVKEKGNRTKCTSNLRTAPAMKVKEKGNRTKMFRDNDDSDSAWETADHIVAPAALKVKEKGNRTKMFRDYDDSDSAWEASGQIVAPAALKVKEKGNRTKCSSNLRTFPPTGELQLQETDLAIAGRGLDFAWVRTYRSRTGSPSPMGANWDHCYNIQIRAWNDATGHFDLWDGTGRSDRFYRGPNGIYTCDEIFCEGTVSNGAFTVTFPDTGKWEFYPVDGSLTAGKIARIMNRNGNTIALSYDLQGRCNQIVDTLGRTNMIGYNSAGLLTTLTDFSGRTVRYEYDPLGNLTSCTSPAVIGTPNKNDFPDGKVTRYNYSQGFTDERLNHNLISITDPKGQLWLQVVYAASTDPASVDFDTVDHVQRGPYRAAKLRRVPQTPSPQNGFAIVKCIENDASGNVTETFYDSRNRCVRQLDYTGRANPDLPTDEKQNRPANKLRPDDPDFYETRWEWNADSLCTRVRYPDGDSAEMVYQRAFNQNSANNARRSDGNLRIFRERVACCIGADTDGDGLPDLTERTWAFEYDSRFGSVGLLSALMCDEDDDSDTSVKTCAKIIQDRDTGRSKGFASRITDPRGGSDLYSYDAKGNLLSHSGRLLDSGDRPVESFEYNSFGQMTLHVHAADGNGRGRMDAIQYYDDPASPQYGFIKIRDTDSAPDDGLHLRTTYEYDSRGNVTRIIDPRTNDWLFTYNSLDQVMTRQTPNNSFGTLVRCTTTFTYDANDNVVRRDIDNFDEHGVAGPNPTWRTQFQYDVLNRMTACWRDKNGNLVLRCTEAQYDCNNNVTLYRSGEAVNGNDPHNVVQSLYDERDLLFRMIQGPGSPQPYSEQYNYTKNGWKHHDISGYDAPTLEVAQTTYEYDGFDRRVRALDPMGNVDTCAYDANDNLVMRRGDGEIEDAAGSAGNRRLAETRWTYDALDRPVQQRIAFFDIFTEISIGDGSSDSTCVYAVNGQLLSQTDDNGHVTRYTYDNAWRMSSVIDPKSNTVVYAYDSNGNVLSVTAHERSDLTPGSDQVFLASFSYDPLNRCVSSRNNVGNVTTYAYDSRGNVVSSIDARGNETVFAYDGLNRCLQTTCYEGTARAVTINTSHVEYNDNSRCTASTDSNGNQTRYAYDSLNRLVATTNPDQTAESLIWSPRSNLASRTDPNGTVTAFTYDLLDRCVRKNVSAASGVAATTTFEEFVYDGLSRLIRGTNDTSMVEFGYDSMGNREKAKADCIAAVAIFDGQGNRLSLTYPSGRVVTCTYDALDQMSTIGSAPLGGVFASHASYGYEGPGRLGRIARPSNGINTRLNWNGLQQPANTAGDFGFQQVSRVNHQRASGGTVVAQRTLTYDRNQNKASSVAAPFVPGGATITSAFRYDPLDRLINSTRSTGAALLQTTDYYLDRVGNRTNVVHGGAVDVYFMDPTTPEPADFQMNQYSLTSLGSEVHDGNGNIIRRDSSSGSTYFHYDYADRLISIDRTVGPAIAPVAAFTYDVLGRRISKTIYQAAPAAPVATQFIYDPDTDGDGIIESRQGGAVVADFVHRGADGEVVLAFNASGEAGYFHHDDLGNVLALTDASGNVLEYYDYDDYGMPSFLDARGAPIVGSDGQPVTQSPLGNPFLFQGMFWDGETGLYAFKEFSPAEEQLKGNPRHRPACHDPKTGQTMSRRDCPSGLCSDGRAFANNNPWSPGEPTVSSMKKGTVKFFNESKGFRAYFNPKELSVDKVVVRGWDPVIKKEEGGRHTPFHNKYLAQFEKGWPCRYEGPRFDSEAGDNFALLMNSKAPDPKEFKKIFRGHVTLLK